MELLKNKKVRRATAAVVCASMLVPVLARGVPLDGIYSDPRVAITWNVPQDILGSREETGLAFNVTWLPKNTNAGNQFPFSTALHFTARPGYENDKFKDFDGRFFYCVASHTQGYRFDAGMQMFFLEEYGINHPGTDIFGPTKHIGNTPEEDRFNFLMTAIACGYPASYDPEILSDAAYYVACQTIAWIATNDDSRGYKGAPPQSDSATLRAAFDADLAYFHSQRDYLSIDETFPASIAPEIYDMMHAQITPTSGAASYGITNFLDAMFYDIWMAAYVTSCLEPDWDKQLSATVTTAREEGGMYYADVDLFVNDAARMYLDGISFKGYGDWVQTGQDEDGTMHFSSPTGETDENGCIGYLCWEQGYIGGFCPVDQTKAKLYTFEGYTDKVSDPNFNFGNTQIYFSSTIDQNINLYIRIGEDTPETGDGEVECVRREHEETFTANYNVNLLKYDSETGKPLADSHWDVLEKFDDTQLDNTDLDREPASPGTYESGLGTLNSTEWGDDSIESNYNGDMGVTVSDTNKYNWGNDGGTQFEKWDDPHEDPCTRDDNVTGEDGLLYETDSVGAISNDQAHTDIKLYTYHKGYCEGHPAPVIEYIDCDHDEEEDCDCEEINQELHDEAWEKWYAEVQKCEKLVAEGGFFHCIEPGDAAKKAMEEDRDQFFKDFISLTYEYSADEILAAKGYILHGTHTDDIPLEWRVVTSSEYKDTEEANTLEHQSSKPESGGEDEDPDGEDEPDEDSDDSSTEDTLWAAAMQDVRGSASDIDWVSAAVKAPQTEDTGNAEDTEDQENTEDQDSAESAKDNGTSVTAVKDTDNASSPAKAKDTESVLPVETEAADTETADTAGNPDTVAEASDGETAAEPEAEAGILEINVQEDPEQGEDSVDADVPENISVNLDTLTENAGSLEEPESLVAVEMKRLFVKTSIASLLPGTDAGEGGEQDTKSSRTAESTGTAYAMSIETDLAAAAEGTDEDGAGEQEEIKAAEETKAAISSTAAAREDDSDSQEEDTEDFLPDMDLLEAGEDGTYATASNATGSEARPEHGIRRTGFFEKVKDAAGEAWDIFTSMVSRSMRAVKAAGRASSYLRNTERFQETKAEYVKPPKKDIVDWTFVVYDHRTEGEIHFNKRDFDLSNNTGDAFDDYAAENGDGTLEGAVYGLFAAQDIIHPDTDGDGDGDTGVVFRKDDLVSIAATDRNGDASFMVITEAPGTVYNYETGSTEYTDWHEEAPGNLHMERDASAAREEDIERFIGHNPDGSEISAGDGADLPDTMAGDDTFHYKMSTNQEYDSGMLENNRVTNNKVDTYREDETTGHYPILDNENNNGNCWIGRPLILGKDGSSYYIKELSRSEGYELSVYGKDGALITNREAFEAGGDDFVSGEASATGLSRDVANGGNTFSVTSSGTMDGYILKAANIPEGAAFYVTTSESYWDDDVSHQEPEYGTEPVYAAEGAQVTIGGKSWNAALGDTITYNGKTFQVNNVMTVPMGKRTVKPDNRSKVTDPYLDVTKITATENVMEDINKLFSKTGFRKVVNGCPWVGVPITSFNTQSVAAAINASILNDDWYSVFNAFEMLGTYQKNGVVYATIGYCYRDVSVNTAIYNSDNQTIYVKTDVDYTAGGSSLTGFAYRAYQLSQCENVKENGNGFVISATVPNETASGNPQYAKEPLEDSLSFSVVPDETVWTYAAGEQLLDNNGDPVLKTVVTYVDVTPTFVTKVTDEEIQGAEFKSNGDGTGTYTIHITQEMIDSAGGVLDFRILYENTTVNVDGSVTSADYYANDHGIIGITFPMGSADSYVEPIFLMYPGDGETMQDADTIAEPIQIYERPIRQKVRIEKDIQTMAETKTVWYCLNCGYENQDGEATCGFCGRERSTEETKSIDYAHDTYAAVHADNISAERDGGWYETAKDWLGNLLKGNSPEEEPESIGGFRFKAYLKSNLERLYRDEDGRIVWMDRNGNTMTPQYEDTNGNGNYDTFTWKYDTAYDGKNVDFPEKDKVSEDNGVLSSSNVQRIYTDVEHRTESMTTSSRANNLWDTYADPQTGARENAGQIEGYTTSEREVRKEGDAVVTNASLYSHDGVLRDRDRTDYLQDEQNHGYTRLLETQKILVEDGTGTISHEAYNYEKFFDAIQAANTDIWDDDMYSTFTGDSMSNYPGQHWFETFYEKYQKDDADWDHTLENTDGVDKDETAGGDRDTSFKPFRWIREHVFGDRSGYEQYPAVNNGENTEVTVNTSDYARANAQASDAVRQFAVKWYLEDEAAKLMIDNGLGENIAKPDGKIGYDEAVYDLALFEAIAKAYNYLRPFYYYDLDTIYSVEWDSAPGGGADKDYTTLSADERLDGRYYNISSYLPYGVYVIVEQTPQRRDENVNDWENRSFDIEKPKEVIVPSVYDGPESNDTTDNYDTHYNFDAAMLLTDQAKDSNYLIRFGEENSANTENQDDRELVIRAHGYHGDFEVYKYGLDIDRLQAEIAAPTGTYHYGGWDITQEAHDPLKDYYETDHRGEEGVEQIGKENGGNDASRYHGFDLDVTDNGNGADTANGSTYDGEALRKRFFYASIAEDDGTADQVLFKDGAVDENNASGMSWHNDVKSTTGELTAYDGKYSAALVPWTMTAPADSLAYDASGFSGYADVNERNSFYTTMLRINKTDSETGEYILHDDAIFGLYAASRYNSFAEIEEDAKLIEDGDERAKFLMQFKPGDAKFYLQDTVITGSREFLEAMKARDLTPYRKRTALNESMESLGNLYTGVVPKGTPVCIEAERISLYDGFGDRTGQMTVWSTRADIPMDDAETQTSLEYGGQNVGYFKTSQPIGAGVYVLAEIKPPDGYVRSKPVAIEVYSDKTTYYADGDMYAKVDAVRYEANLLDEYPYK